MIVYHVLLVSFYEQVFQNASHVPGVAIPSPSSLKMFVKAAESEMVSSTFGEIPSDKMTSAWATSSTKTDADTGSNSEKQQISSVSGKSSKTDQNTEARVALTTPEVDLPQVLNNEKYEEVHQLKQSQEKSPEEERKMTMPKLTHKSRRSPQILAKSKTVEFKLEAKLQQAELALIESQNQYDLCKIPLYVFF